MVGVLLLATAIIVWQLLLSLKSHQLLTNAGRARKAGEPLPVSTAVAQWGSLDTLVAAECVARESAKVVLSTDVGGSVILVNAKVGDKVAEGQLLVKLNESVLKAVYKNTEQTELALETLRDELKPFVSDVHKLRDKGIAPATDLLDAIERLRRAEFDLTRVRREKIHARAGIESTEIVSPISGVLTSLEVAVGTVLRSYQDAVTVSQLDPMWLECKFAADRLPVIHDFDKANASFPAYPGKVSSVDLEKILPVSDEKTHGIVAHFKLRNEEQQLLPGMQAVVRLSKHVEAVKIPAISLINRAGDSANIFVVDKNRLAHFVRIGTGRYAEGYVEVSRGLERGQHVVVVGQHLLQDGDVVTEVKVDVIGERANKTLFPTKPQ